MKISTKGRYAVRVMLELSLHDEEAYVPLDEIAANQGISKKYLESIVKNLVKADLVSGLRGKGGGYRLSRKPRSYTVGSILKAAEGSLAPVACLEDGAECCPREKGCATLSLWQGLYQRIEEYVEGVTLEDLKNEVLAEQQEATGRERNHK